MENFDFASEEENNLKKRLALSGAAYSVASVLPILLSLIAGLIISSVCGAQFGQDGNFPDWYIYLLFLLPQISLLATAVFYFCKSGERATVLIKPCKPKYFLIALFLQFGLLFSLSELNKLFIRLLELLGYSASGVPLPDVSGWNFLPALLVIALLPALLEETLFRGILSRIMQNSHWGILPSVLITGAMFSLFHGNPEQTVYQFFCGVCLTFVALRAGSVLPTVLAHFANNAIILILSAFGYGDFTEFGTAWYISLIVLSSLFLIGSLVYLLFFDRKKGGETGKIKWKSIFFSAAAIGLSVCAVEWIYGLIAGFYG